MLRAIDVMSRNVLTINEDTSIAEAAKLMTQEQVGSLIISKNELPVGIITETDLTRKVVAVGADNQAPVKDFMNSPIYYSAPDADIIEIANAMSTNHIKKIPVLDAHKVLGIVTQTDIIKHIFRTVRALELSYRQGSMSSDEFAQKFSSTFHDFEGVPDGTVKNWYMRCADCGNTFMNPEENGHFKSGTCPRCSSSDLQFDQSPPV